MTSDPLARDYGWLLRDRPAGPRPPLPARLAAVFARQRPMRPTTEQQAWADFDRGEAADEARQERRA